MNSKRNKVICKLLSVVLLFTIFLGTGLAKSTVATEAASYQKAWFPMAKMNLTQIAFESYSHSNSQHIDCTGSTYAFAPFTGKIVAYTSNYGAMIFQSSNKVYYADGTLDYMSVMFMHGTLYSGLSVGSTVSQGSYLYKLGGLGSGGTTAYGVHLDCGVYKGLNSSYGSYYSRFGNTYPFNAFFINTSKTTSITNKGKLASGNTVSRSDAPTNYSSLWKTTTQVGSGTPSVTYQVYDTSAGKWLANVTDRSDYAGIYGHSVSAVYASLSSGNITYRVHVKGGSWLSAVTNRSDYAGITSKPIDGLMMTTDTGKTIHYRVHIKGGSWLPYVTGYSTSDSNNGYAGIFGSEIDAIQVYLS